MKVTGRIGGKMKIRMVTGELMRQQEYYEGKMKTMEVTGRLGR